ncbi:protealysin inhibitor emfourin [Lysinimonas soli]|uniref:Protealysin inhibitor emfourin n=1 Tax=Lysinimonas soli TaxID=1074233 RepID=A0ABW0NQH6_9MICO
MVPGTQGDDEGESPGDAEGFRILVVRSGGIAGLRQQWVVDSPGEAGEWLELVQACPWGAVRPDPESRDRFVWRIEATTPPERHAASVPERDLVGPWRTLVDRVKEHGTHG